MKYLIIIPIIILIVIDVSALSENYLSPAKVRYSDEIDKNKYIEISANKEIYRCLEQCTILINLSNHGLLEEYKKYNTSSSFTKKSITFKKPTQINVRELEIPDAKHQDNYNILLEYTFSVPIGMPEYEFNVTLTLNDKDTFILDPTIISGCDEDTEINCSGSITGNYLSSAKNINFFGASVNAEQANDIGIFNITSTNGNIFINDSAIEADGATGKEGYFILTAKNGEVKISDTTINARGGDATGITYPQTGNFFINASDIIINGTTDNNYGGSHGCDGDTSIGGSTGFLTLIAINDISMFNVNTFNSYGGNGGLCHNGGSATGGAGIATITATNFNIYNKTTINLKNGNCDTGGYSGSCNYNTKTASITANINWKSNNTFNVTLGTTGSGLSQVHFKSQNEIRLDEDVYLQNPNPSPQFNKLNFTGTSGKLMLNDVTISNQYYVYCKLFTNPLMVYYAGRIDQDIDFGSCSSYNVTSLAEYEAPYPYFTNNRTNLSEPRINDVIALNITVNDNEDLGHFRLSHNQSETFVNQSIVVLSGASDIITRYVFNLSITLIRGNRIGWQIWANDSHSWINISPIYYFDIINTLPLTGNVSFIPSIIGDNEIATGYWNYSDNDDDSIAGNDTRWYLNNSILNIGKNISTLGAGNVTAGTVIIYSVRTYDGYNYSPWVNSSEKTVADTTPPKINNISLSLTSAYTDQIVNISCIVLDIYSSISSVKVTINNNNLSMNLLTGGVYVYAATFGLGDYNISTITAIDGANNIQTNNTNLSFVVISQPGGEIGGGGGGGTETVNQTNKTIYLEPECNYNDICEAGEDSINCPNDCPFEIYAWNPFCLLNDKDTQCIWRRSFFAAFSVVLVFGSMFFLAISSTDTYKKISKKFKKFKFKDMIKGIKKL